MNDYINIDKKRKRKGKRTAGKWKNEKRYTGRKTVRKW